MPNHDTYAYTILVYEPIGEVRRVIKKALNRFPGIDFDYTPGKFSMLHNVPYFTVFSSENVVDQLIDHINEVAFGEGWERLAYELYEYPNNPVSED